MDKSFFIICGGVLLCYAVLRTVKRDWIRVPIVLVLVACLSQVILNDFYPRRENAEAAPTAAASAPLSADQGRGFFGRLAGRLQNDRCVLGYLRESPISPAVYALELHQFMENFKKMQASQLAGTQNLAHVSQLVRQSFGDTAPALSAAEVTAVQSGQDSAEALCSAFGKWANKVSAYPQGQQQQIWQSLQSAFKEQPSVPAQ